MKNKVLNMIYAITFAVAMAASFTGCTANDVKNIFNNGGDAFSTANTRNVCLIVSPTANQHKPDISLANEELYDSCYSYGYKACVVDDGKPFLAFEADLTKEDRVSGLSEENKKLDAEAYVDSFIEKAESVQALTAEKDTIKSIRIASDSLYDCAGEKTIVLIDNGISTTGIVKFKSLKGFQVDEAISALSDNDYPNLTGYNIVWYGLGDTVAPQNELSPDDLDNLKAYWETYLRNAGASDVRFPKKVTVNTTVDNSTLPWVSTVEVSPILSKIPDFEELSEQIENLPVDEKDNVIGESLELGLKLDETSSVQFKPDSLELTNKEKAIEVIKPLADYLKSNPNKQILLMGTTASVGSNDSCVKFSLGRAEKSHGFRNECKYRTTYHYWTWI